MIQTLKTMMAIALLALTFHSCEKDAGKLPTIKFKTGSAYYSADASVNKGSTVMMGIDAAKSEDKDVLKKFNISVSKNGAAASSVFSKDLSGTEGDAYSYEHMPTLDTAAGVTYKYTYTVTNRDGLTNQVSLTLTTK